MITIGTLRALLDDSELTDDIQLIVMNSNGKCYPITDVFENPTFKDLILKRELAFYIDL